MRELGSKQLSWRDLFVLVRRWQRTPGNAVAAAVHEHEIPSWTEQVLAQIVDLLIVVDFHIRKGKGTRPKRFKRWWEKVTQKFGRDPIPMSQFNDWWESAGKQ